MTSLLPTIATRLLPTHLVEFVAIPANECVASLVDRRAPLRCQSGLRIEFSPKTRGDAALRLVYFSKEKMSERQTKAGNLEVF